MALLRTPEPVLGSRASDFTLADGEGKRFTRDGLLGDKGLVVMFICNHCPYVKAIRARLVRDSHELIAMGFGVVAINSNDGAAYPEDSPKRMVELAREFEYPFPYLVDMSQDVARAYGAVCTPDFFGYNQRLELQYRGRLDAGHAGPRTAGMTHDLLEAMREVAETGQGPIIQQPSMGCSLKWISARV